MSQDLMQALSGSSLLSVAIGTLPAGKQGMSLDANPFASQLALMTGTDMAVTGALAPAAAIPATGEGAFAVALDEVAAPVAPDAPMRALMAADVAPVVPAPAAAPLAAAPKMVAELPEDASATQIIEAALTGSASVEAAPVTLAVADKRAGTEKTAAAPNPLAPKTATPVVAAPQTSTPYMQTGTGTPATVLPVAQAAARPVVAIDAPMPAEAQLMPAPEPEVALAEDAATLPSDTPRPQRRARAEAVVLTADVPVAIAMAQAPIAQPLVQPEAPVTDLGTTRILTKAALQAPRQAASDDTAVLPGTAPASNQGDRPQLVQSAATSEDPTALEPRPHRLAETAIPADIAAAPIGAPLAAPIAAAPIAAAPAASEPAVARAGLAAAPVSAPQPARPAAFAAAPLTTADRAPTFAPASAPVAQAQPAAEPRPMTSAAPLAAAPLAAVAGATQPVQPAVSVTASADPVVPMAPAVPEAVQAVAQPSAAAVSVPTEAVAQPASPATATAPVFGSTTPVANNEPAATTAPQQVALPVQAQPIQAQPVQVQPVMQAVQAQQVQASPAPRIASVAPRAAFTPAARRAIDSAVQSPRPAEALTALFDRADFDIDPAAPLARTDFSAPATFEAVPPSWAAALNAVSSPTQQMAGVAAPQASAQVSAAPLETLNFGAGFVANIETQIARVANGGQMVRMQIMPENLGRIDIEMLAGPERDQVRIVTEHDAVRDTLVSSQHRLEQDLRSNAQRPTEVTVELRQQSPGTQNGSAQQQQQRGQSGAEAASAREAAQRQATSDPAADATPAARRPRGNIRYA